MTNIRLTIAFLSVFVIGLGVGLMIDFRDSEPEPSVEPTEYEDRRGEYGQRDGEDRAERYQRMQRQMREQLNLSDESAEQLFALIRESRAERRDMMQESREQFRLDMERQQENFQAGLQEILDDEQLAIWDSLYSRERQQRRLMNRERQGD